jgi:hypothetical protein
MRYSVRLDGGGAEFHRGSAWFVRCANVRAPCRPGRLSYHSSGGVKALCRERLGSSLG